MCIFNGHRYPIFEIMFKKNDEFYFFLSFGILNHWMMSLDFLFFYFRAIIRLEPAQVQVITLHGPSILRTGIISTANLPQSLRADPEPLDHTSMLTSSLPLSPPFTMVCITPPGGRMKTWGQGRGPGTRRIGWNGLMLWINGFQNR